MKIYDIKIFTHPLKSAQFSSISAQNPTAPNLLSLSLSLQRSEVKTKRMIISRKFDILKNYQVHFP